MNSSLGIRGVSGGGLVKTISGEEHKLPSYIKPNNRFHLAADITQVLVLCVILRYESSEISSD